MGCIGDAKTLGTSGFTLVLWGYVLSVRLFICLYYCLFLYPYSPFDTIPEFY